jgi:molybdenum cofactor biosynthesis enzyme MoaA
MSQCQRRLGAGRRFALSDGTVFGIISSTTEPFCRTCDRSRPTADGMWFPASTRPVELTSANPCGAVR